MGLCGALCGQLSVLQMIGHSSSQPQHFAGNRRNWGGDLKPHQPLGREADHLAQQIAIQGHSPRRFIMSSVIDCSLELDASNPSLSGNIDDNRFVTIYGAVGRAASPEATAKR